MSSFLPGTVGERLGDLMNGEGINQIELAEKLGVSGSMISRIVKGQTQTINSDTLVKLAKYFNVSTDFLTGTTDIPDPINYDTMELGLSAVAASNLYRQKANIEVVNLLLESDSFADLTNLIADFIHDKYAAGYAAHNQMLDTVSNILMGVGGELPRLSGPMREAVGEVNKCAIPPYQVERLKIQDSFMRVLDEMKHTGSEDIKASRLTVQNMMRDMVISLTKGQDALVPKVTAEQTVDAIMRSMAITEAAPEALDKLREGITAFFNAMLPIPDNGEVALAAK